MSKSCQENKLLRRCHAGEAKLWALVGQRHFRGASNRERVPLLAVVNDRTRRAGASTTASSAVLHAPASLLGVVVAENVWKPRSNSKQWHTLRQCCRTKWRCPFKKWPFLGNRLARVILRERAPTRSVGRRLKNLRSRSFGTRSFPSCPLGSG